ncbi:MAG: hypothetical protein NVS3B21_35390 [Acidimicrobiales bacterium]
MAYALLVFSRLSLGRNGSLLTIAFGCVGYTALLHGATADEFTAMGPSEVAGTGDKRGLR